MKYELLKTVKLLRKYLPPCNNESYLQNLCQSLSIFNPLFNHCPNEPQHLLSTFSHCHEFKKKKKHLASKINTCFAFVGVFKSKEKK